VREKVIDEPTNAPFGKPLTRDPGGAPIAEQPQRPDRRRGGRSENHYRA
jgi:hypothetical protein